MKTELLKALNAPTCEERLLNLRAAVAEAKFPPAVPQYINNHIHTIYSFSPYSPTAAVFAAKEAGLCTAGIVDHDSLSGAREFLAAAEIIDIPVTVGMECRVSFSGTPFADARLNNPDQKGIGYMTIQSVPHDAIEEMNDFFAPYRALREERNRRMIENLNALLSDFQLDYDADVRTLSQAEEGGSVTERHLMFALAKKLIDTYGKGEALIGALQELGVELSEKQTAQMTDAENPFYDYDLLGILKSAFVEKIYVAATEECPPLSLIVVKCREVDAILCYAYLGDVGDSVTGDKKAQKFEDDYLDELFAFLDGAGVRALTYMPSRNTREQLLRLRALCEQYDMFQVSGEDINSPRQSFVIKAMEDPLFANLIEATWKLIEHEQS